MNLWRRKPGEVLCNFVDDHAGATQRAGLGTQRPQHLGTGDEDHVLERALAGDPIELGHDVAREPRVELLEVVGTVVVLRAVVVTRSARRLVREHAVRLPPGIHQVAILDERGLFAGRLRIGVDAGVRSIDDPDEGAFHAGIRMQLTCP
jgi:hypothetical protein